MDIPKELVKRVIDYLEQVDEGPMMVEYEGKSDELTCLVQELQAAYLTSDD